MIPNPINEKKTIVIFDLDGTITKYDTYKIFLLLGLKKFPSKWKYIPELCLTALKNKIGLLDNTKTKALFLDRIFRNSTEKQIEEVSTELALFILKYGLRKSSLETIEMHRKAGARILIATASLDIYSKLIARYIGIDEVIATRCEIKVDGDLSGQLLGKNLKSTEKVVAIKERLGDEFDGAITIAYSDHHSDLPLLLSTTKGIAVNPTPKLFMEAKKRSLTIEDWDT